MKVLLLSGASSIHTIRWANAYAERGLEVHLVTQHDPVEAPDPRVQLHRFPHRRGLGYLLNGPRLRRLIDRLAIDVVNAHYATGYGTLARWVKRAPLVLNVWGSDVYDFPEAGPVHRWLVRRNLLRADRVVSTSHAMAARTKAICPGLKEITVVPFGVDTHRFAPPAMKPEDRPFVVGTVKSLAPKYGIDVLIRAFAQFAARSSDPVELHLVGSGPQEGELKALAQELGVADRVRFKGRVAHAQVPAELQRMHLYAALSALDSESFGVAVIEASACGLPVLVSDVGGLPEVVVDGATGWVVPRGAIGPAAERMAEALASPELRARMGAAGVVHVRKAYEWSHNVDGLLRVLKEVTKAGGAK